MMTTHLLSASDLHAIADALAVIETDERLTENPVFGRIEVICPDGNPDDVVSYFEIEGARDGSGSAWYGYRSAS